jgi:pimeloyl-ACP methyl ester carboxylesterase
MLNFRTFGSGPNLIVLHGLYGASDNWLTIGKKLQAYYTVYLVDLRNHGRSPHFSSHTYSDMAEDLKIFFKEVNIKKATILGHSMGGKTAMMFAADYPEYIEGLIIADIAPKDYSTDSEKSHGIIHHKILSLLDGLDLFDISSREEIDLYLSKDIPSQSLRGFLMKNIRRSKTGIFEWKINVPVLKKYLPEIIKEVNPDFFEDRKPILSYPITFIRGINSEYLTDNDIPVIKDIYPNAKIIDIKNAGHWLHAEQPEKFIEAIIKNY